MMSAERQARSVFVGNIPFDVTEQALREIFAQAGTILSFKVVCDKDTGKPKGYGFCEYSDPEIAASAIRNLNNYEYHGRNLRVSTSAGGDELRQAAGPAIDEPYGPPCEPDRAPEEISKAVASLPPEEMFELMKQMKLCIQNNPEQARQMLLENPQLAYALLQAQIVMKIVDPQVAMAMLHRETPLVPPVMPSSSAAAPAAHDGRDMQPPLSQSGGGPPFPQPNNPFTQPFGAPGPPFSPQQQPQAFGAPGGGFGFGRPPRPGGPQRPLIGDAPPGMRPRMGPVGGGGPGFGPRGGGGGDGGPFMRGPAPQHSPGGGDTVPPTSSSAGAVGGAAASLLADMGSEEDQEKAMLIMQVLQLTDEQILHLPPDQRASIQILKEQFAQGK